jgi:formate/nitrite transporter
MSDSPQYDPKLNTREWGGAISRLGIRKANTRFWQLLLLGFLGGLYISFGGHLFLAALAGGAGRVVASFLFSIGLVLVVVAGAELFTGNIIMVVGLIGGRYKIGKLMKNWGAVYLGNLIGSLLYAFLVWKSGLFGKSGEPNAIGSLAALVAESKVMLPFSEALIRGIFCNMLVILAIIMSIMAKDVVSKILCCMLPVAAFVTVGFEHCVANMFLIPVGYLSAGIPLSDWGGMIPGILTITMGNIVGGLFILIVHPNRLRQLGFMRGGGKAV